MDCHEALDELESAEELENMKKANQSGRFARSEEVASAVLFLLSPGSSFISGETVRVDAGESLYSPMLPPQTEDQWI